MWNPRIGIVHSLPGRYARKGNLGPRPVSVIVTIKQKSRGFGTRFWPLSLVFEMIPVPQPNPSLPELFFLFSFPFLQRAPRHFSFLLFYCFVLFVQLWWAGEPRIWAWRRLAANSLHLIQSPPILLAKPPPKVSLISLGPSHLRSLGHLILYGSGLTLYQSLGPWSSIPLFLWSTSS